MEYRQHRTIFLILFALSGFAGLIYESIWSHYLKLFLGHAAYAQTLVLAIFMGGMTIGAWIPSLYSVRWKNLLVAYALVEVIIGLCAITFHKLFINVTDAAYDSIMPLLASPWLVNLFKWALAAMLILPQSTLLGMTFPLMSASLIRRYPINPGTNLAMLYFTNSFGAAIGVLVSGFVLIELVGLPGTIFTAGLISIGVGLAVWLIARNTIEPTAQCVAPTILRGNTPVSWRLFIAVSFLTGAASFIYEIGWIRMLNLVLGTSTHAFELMLSAFIVGLAFGGLWIKRRIDHLEQPVQFLGWVQVVMGLLALTTLTAYNTSFDMMQLLIRSVTATDGGYFLFNLGSHAIAILIMVPVTFCAGMTLPLITQVLLRGGYGEKSIGAVYAANTAGAIVGVFFAVHIGLSTLGLKGLIITGAALDMALGFVLLCVLVKPNGQRSMIAALVSAIAVFITVLEGVEFDRYKMASGVYRHGQYHPPDQTEILYHKDGKTATIDLLKNPNGGISIITNGKADARINMADHVSASSDESTMTLAASIPLLLHPEAQTVANIGMGSGLTTQVLLGSTSLKRVDTIEIESAMIEASRGFHPRVEAPFSDPRSHFFIDDAKTYFSANQSRYDIIVSEPSNPWVSGVSGLYTDEFYQRVRTHLNPSGIFVQWIHVYEMDFDLVASVMKAIGRNFSDYDLYAANDSDLLIVAVRENKAPVIDKRKWIPANLMQALRRIDIHTVEDLELRRIGNRALLEPLFIYAPIPVNSDFFPVLDLHAVRTRFMKTNVVELTLLRADELPAIELLSGGKTLIAKMRPTLSDHFQLSHQTYIAAVIQDFYANNDLHPGDGLELDLLRHMLLTLRLANNCRGASTPDLWFESVYEIMKVIIPSTNPSEMDALWHRFRTSDCYRKLTTVQQDMFSLFGAIGRRDAPKMAAHVEKLLNSGMVSHEREEYFLAAGMLGHLANNRPEEAHYLWKSHARRVLGSRQPSLLLRLLWSHSIHRIQNREHAKS